MNVQRMAVNFKEWDQQIDDISNTDNKEQLYLDMKSELNDTDNQVPVLWRLAKVCVMLSVGVEDKRRQKEFAFEALAYGKRACDLDAQCVDCHKWYCVALGRVAKYCTIKDKVKYGQIFKRHLDIAHRLDANDFLLHFMAGRYAYELSSLSWLERTVVNSIYGSMPATSFDEALKEFTICNQLRPHWKDNYLWIAKTLIAMKNKRKAKDWVDRGLALKSRDKLDEMAHEGLNKLKNDHKLD